MFDIYLAIFYCKKFLLICRLVLGIRIMYNNKVIGFIINSTIKNGKKELLEEPDFQRIGLCGILNFLSSTNPQKTYFGQNIENDILKVFDKLPGSFLFSVNIIGSRDIQKHNNHLDNFHICSSINCLKKNENRRNKTSTIEINEYNDYVLKCYIENIQNWASKLLLFLDNMTM